MLAVPYIVIHQVMRLNHKPAQLVLVLVLVNFTSPS